MIIRRLPSAEMHSEKQTETYTNTKWHRQTDTDEIDWHEYLLVTQNKNTTHKYKMTQKQLIAISTGHFYTGTYACNQFKLQMWHFSDFAWIFLTGVAQLQNRSYQLTEYLLIVVDSNQQLQSFVNAFNQWYIKAELNRLKKDLTR